MAELQFSIYRFDPDHDSEPRMQEFSINRADCKGAMLLDHWKPSRANMMKLWHFVVLVVKECVALMA